MKLRYWDTDRTESTDNRLFAVEVVRPRTWIVRCSMSHDFDDRRLILRVFRVFRVPIAQLQNACADCPLRAVCASEKSAAANFCSLSPAIGWMDREDFMAGETVG